jgi:hypothetical protein
MPISSVSFVTGCAIDQDSYYIAYSPDKWAETQDDPYTVICIYQHTAKKKWAVSHELRMWNVISMTFPLDMARKVYALDEQGNIERYSLEESSVERIIDAGLDNQGKYGYVHKIRFIGNRLYVSGYSGQVYRKEGAKWVHFDKGLLRPSVNNFSMGYKSVPKDDTQALMNFFSKMVEDRRSLFDINGLSESSIYVVGTEGFIAYFNGFEWSILKRVTAADLHSIHIISEQDIWIVGSKGTVLRGNAKNGFKVLSRKALETDFYAITCFDNEIYIAGDSGIYTLKGEKLQRQNISDTENLREVSCIEAKDGVLWALSEKKLLRLQRGSNWEVFKHPNNV